MKNGQTQDATPVVGSEGNFFNDFFISEEELANGPSDGTEAEEVEDQVEEQTEENEEIEATDETSDTEESGEESESEDEASEKSDEEGSTDDGNSGDQEESDDDEEGDSGDREANTEWDLSSQMENYVNDGLLVADPDREYDEGDAGMKQLIDDTVKSKLAEAVVESNKGRRQDVTELESYLTNNPGATIENYLQEQNEDDYTQANENDPDHAVLLLQDMYSLQGLPQEEINQNIKEHQSSGSLHRHAKHAKKVMVKWQDDLHKAKAEKRQAEAQQREVERVERVRTFEQNVLKTESIGGIELSPKERQELSDYIVKPVDEHGNSALMLDEATSDEASLLYAYIRKNKLDLSKLERKAQTKAAIKFKNKINRHTDKLAKKQSSRNGGTRNAKDGDLSGLDSWTPAGN